MGVEGGSILPNGAKTRKANSGARQRAEKAAKRAKHGKKQKRRQTTEIILISQRHKAAKGRNSGKEQK